MGKNRSRNNNNGNAGGNGGTTNGVGDFENSKRELQELRKFVSENLDDNTWYYYLNRGEGNAFTENAYMTHGALYYLSQGGIKNASDLVDKLREDPVGIVNSYEPSISSNDKNGDTIGYERWGEDGFYDPHYDPAKAQRQAENMIQDLYDRGAVYFDGSEYKMNPVLKELPLEILQSNARSRYMGYGIGGYTGD